MLKFKFGSPGMPISKFKDKLIVGIAGIEIDGKVIGGIEKLKLGNPGIPTSRGIFKSIDAITGRVILGIVIGGIEKLVKSQGELMRLLSQL